MVTKATWWPLATSGGAMPEHGNETVPEWNGNPAAFEALVRYHVLPRLLLLNPLRAPANCLVSLDDLVGTRTTLVRPPQGGTASTITDTVDIQRNFLIAGLVRLDLSWLTSLRSQSDNEYLHNKVKRASQKNLYNLEKKKVTWMVQLKLNNLQHQQELWHKRYDHEDLDGTPMPTTSRSTSYAAPGCMLSGGHGGYHRDQQGAEFLYSRQAGHRKVVSHPEDGHPDSSSSSTTSEELLPDEPEHPGEDQQAVSDADEDTFVAIDIPTTMEDFKWPWQSGPVERKVPRGRREEVGPTWRPCVGQLQPWQSGPVEPKVPTGRSGTSKREEVGHIWRPCVGQLQPWQSGPVERQVPTSSAAEESGLARRCQKKEKKWTGWSCRWVRSKSLTQRLWYLKSPRWSSRRPWETSTRTSLPVWREAKARLVILGFQAPNITEIGMSLATMSKVT